MQSEIDNALSGPRMRGKYDEKILADLKQRLENALQNYAVVDVGRAMQGDQRVAPGIALGIALVKPVLVLTLRGGQKLHQRINHHVANAEDPYGVNSLFLKIEVSILGRRKQHIGKLIGDQPVDFLWHSAIEGAQSGFDVSDAHSEFGADQRGGDR